MEEQGEKTSGVSHRAGAKVVHTEASKGKNPETKGVWII